MKNNIFVLILICLVSGFITAQNDSNAALSIQRAKSDFGNRSASTFQKYCRELLDSDAKAMNSPILKLYPRIKSKGGSMIEGMETVTSSVIELQLIIKNDITKDKVEWSNSYDQYQSELCGKNLHEAQLEAAAGRYNRAISKLYCISYDAPCAGEALVVAKQISESSKSNLRADDQGAISNIVLYLDGGKSSSWYNNQLQRLRYR